MNKKINFKIIKLFLVIFILFLPNLNNAKELLIYADTISYDENDNIIAKGNAKIFQENKLILSDLIIVNKVDKKIILPTKFIFKDEEDNYYEGENGFFFKKS